MNDEHILDKSIAFISIFYAYSFFVFTHIVNVNLIGYIVYLSIIAIGMILIIKNNSDLIQRNIHWIPFVGYSIISILTHDKVLGLLQWGSVFVFLLAWEVAEFSLVMRKYLEAFHMLGVFFAIGCVIQKLLPSLYFKVIFPIFTASGKSVIMHIYSYDHHMTGFCYQSDHTANYIAMGIIAWIALTIFERTKAFNLKNVVMLGLLIYGMLLTGKRANFAFLLAALLIVYVISADYNKVIYRLVFAIVAVCISYGLIIAIAPYVDASSTIARLANSFQGGGGESVGNGREGLIELAIPLFRRNPIFGVGWGNFMNMTHSTMATHNVYLQLLCETGLVGLALFIFGELFSLKITIENLRKSKNKNGIIFFVTVYQIFCVLYCAVENVIYNIDYLIFYYFCVAISSVYHWRTTRRRRNERFYHYDGYRRR